MITYYSARRLFMIQTAAMSYAMVISNEDKLLNVYWGPRLRGPECLDGRAAKLRGISSQVDRGIQLPYEYRTQEPFDYLEPAMRATYADGTRDTRLAYVSHVCDGSRLTITLRDTAYPCTVELHYELYGNLDLLSRYAVIRNDGETPFTLTVAKSATVNLPTAVPFRITHFAGNWGAEFGKQQCLLTDGQFVLENHRGTCAAHQHIPFVMLDPRGESTETMGEVYYAALHWSGNFKLTVEQNYFQQTALTAGINEFDCDYPLQQGERLETPRLTLGFSDAGFEHMSEMLYDWQFDYLSPQTKAHAIRPIIYNSWYPYLFDVREENMLGLIDKAADIGAELFVIDDGWMPKRSDDKAGLGDWVPDPERLPNGFTPIVKACHERGLLFGLWVEPEMVNPDSELYRAHPDWIIRDPKREPTLKRTQFTLDFSRDEIRDWAIDWLDKLIRTYELDYLKWDMNRYLSEVGTDKSLSIKYIQNLYKVWETLNQRFPKVLFENCASGGGRADFGMIPYADRVNRSDNAIPTDVMLLHEGFSRLFVPKTAGGAGNISSYDKAPLPFRIHLGMTGSMSIGINLLKADEKTLAELKQATAAFKEVRESLQNAYVYRIASAELHPYVIWQYVCRDRKSFGVFVFSQGARLWDMQQLPLFRLRGLEPDREYVAQDGTRHFGSELMNVGLELKIDREYYSNFLFYRGLE